MGSRMQRRQRSMAGRESPSDLNEEHTGRFRVSVHVADTGGSGLAGQVPQLDYRIGCAACDGYEGMVSPGEHAVGTFDICGPGHGRPCRVTERTLHMSWLASVLSVAGDLSVSAETVNSATAVNGHAPRITAFEPAGPVAAGRSRTMPGLQRRRNRRRRRSVELSMVARRRWRGDNRLLRVLYK